MLDPDLLNPKALSHDDVKDILYALILEDVDEPRQHKKIGDNSDQSYPLTKEYVFAEDTTFEKLGIESLSVLTIAFDLQSKCQLSDGQCNHFQTACYGKKKEGVLSPKQMLDEVWKVLTEGPYQTQVSALLSNAKARREGRLPS